MINASNIFLKYGDRVLMNSINVVIGEKDKVGLVGRNGAGKSTLLKIIANYINPDSGTITRPNGSTLGFLHQEMRLPKGKTVMQETLTAFDQLKALEQRIQEINDEIATRTDYESEDYSALLQEFADSNDRFLLLGGDKTEAQAERVLKGLGFKSSDFNRLTDEFSGGWQMRIELTKMLLQQPDYLLLDEPTNHLDIESIIWLESFLKQYSGAVIVISHDKQFLDNVTQRTIEIELGNVYDYKAAYSKYVELRAERRAKDLAAYENQQRVIAEKERTINRFMAKATKTKMAQSMKKQLDKMERIEIAQEDLTTMNLRFPPAPRSGQIVVEGQKISKSYGALDVLKNVDIQIERQERIAFVGQNGQGKTTLAKILIHQTPSSAGDAKLGHNVQVGYYAQNQSDEMVGSQTLLETMEQHSPPELRTKLRSILGAFMFRGEDVEKKVSVLSGGERARLALACLLLKPFNLLVLDEPTNHLDMLSKEVLKQALLEYDGTILVVSHDRDFLDGLTNKTFEFRDKQIFEHLGDISAFLEKRAMDNMREVEMKTTIAMSNSKVSKYDKSDPKIRKQLLRNVQKAEKQIEKLEVEIEKIEAAMTDSEFYNKPESTKTLEKYSRLKKELEQTMEEWENAQLEWEEFES